MELHLDAKSSVPLYRQLAERLANAIKCGELAEGRLPTGEMLSTAAGVSLGTVKAAIAELERRGLVVRRRGSGVYVVGSKVEGSASHREGAFPQSSLPRITPGAPLLETGDTLARSNAVAESLADTLISLRGIGTAEAFGVFRRVVSEEFSRAGKIRAAWVDCTEETLHATLQQLAGIEQLALTPFLQDDLFLKKVSIGPEYELVLTTQLHFEDVARFLASSRVRVEQIGLRETRATIEALSTIPEGENICILYRSAQLLSSIRYTLGVLGRQNPQMCVNESELGSKVDAYIRTGCTVIIPPDYLEYSGMRMLQTIERARKCGCRIVPFEFEVDRGSILHLRQRLRELGKEQGEA